MLLIQHGFPRWLTLMTLVISMDKENLYGLLSLLLVRNVDGNLWCFIRDLVKLNYMGM